MKKLLSQWTQFMQLRKEAWKKKIRMRWFMMKESRTLETFVFFFFFTFLLDQHESVIESVTDSPPPPSRPAIPASVSCSFSKWKKDRREAWVYPPRRVSQPFIFGESSINLVFKKSKWKREREKRSNSDSTRKRHWKDCKKTMPLVLEIFFS